MIEGQLWAGEDAPVPMVYESPRARYLIANPTPPTRPCPSGRATLRAKRRPGWDLLIAPLRARGNSSLYVSQGAPHVHFRADAAYHLIGEVCGCGAADLGGGANSVGYRLQRRLVDRARGVARPVVLHVAEQGGDREDHGQGVRDVLSLQRRRRAVRRLGHSDLDRSVV